jgi:TfuA protein
MTASTRRRPMIDSHRPLVYLGPSLAVADAQQILQAEYRPPIRRGDLKDVAAGTIVIIDGEFGQSLAVSPKEILSLLRAGTRVIGAASMGALRAAELHTFGMEGVGAVYEAYRSGRLTRDDEVALSYCPETLAPLTVPLVNIRFLLERLLRVGQVTAPLAAALLTAAEDIFFADRTESRLWTSWKAMLTPTQQRRLRHAAQGLGEDVKARDSRMALQAAASHTPVKPSKPTRRTSTHVHTAADQPAARRSYRAPQPRTDRS